MSGLITENEGININLVPVNLKADVILARAYSTKPCDGATSIVRFTDKLRKQGFHKANSSSYLFQPSPNSELIYGRGERYLLLTRDSSDSWRVGYFKLVNAFRTSPLNYDVQLFKDCLLFISNTKEDSHFFNWIQKQGKIKSSLNHSVPSYLFEHDLVILARTWFIWRMVGPKTDSHKTKQYNHRKIDLKL